MAPESMPAEGELVLVSNGKDIAIAEFVAGEFGKREKAFAIITLAAEGTITHWAPLPALP